VAGSSALKPSGAERRQTADKRHLLRLTGTLVTLESDSAGISDEAIIRNISPTGVLLETSQPVAMGQMIHIDLGAAGRQEATVRWVDGKLLGCQFPEPLTKSRISAALLQGDHHEQGRPIIAERASSPLTPGSQRRNFGLAIAWARKTKGVNQAELAQAIGVSTTTICKWEKGHAQPRAAALVRLQTYLQDTEAYAAELSLAQTKAPKSQDKDIPGLTLGYKASLANLLGLKIEAIEVQVMIKDITGA
jgi:transcriptional regulator with XRE-family HTH domain